MFLMGSIVYWEYVHTFVAKSFKKGMYAEYRVLSQDEYFII